MKNKEIERKFLLSSVPTGYTVLDSCIFYQSYIFTDKEKESRIRERINPDCSKDYKVTFKSGGTLVRDEINIKITEEQYMGLLNLTKGEPIRKDYIALQLGDYELQTGVVDKGKPTEFTYAEIEFNTEEEANNFNINAIPNLIKEVTNDDSYKMKNYWKRTRG